ncbi:hypothetical protein LX36DRAFT_658608 [Colletotrichum falcatum]|nr:hypothetical protein LX36DRAFT_658608 [Colletotrichum falcatum]
MNEGASSKAKQQQQQQQQRYEEWAEKGTCRFTHPGLRYVVCFFFFSFLQTTASLRRGSLRENVLP